MKMDRLRAGIAGAAMILAAGAAHSQDFYRPEAGAEVPADFFCEDVGIVEIVKVVMEDGSLKASNRVVKETTEQNLCFSLGIPVPVELVKKVMRFTDASGAQLEVWSLELPPELEEAILMTDEMSTVVYVIIQVGLRDTPRKDSASQYEMFLW